MIYAYFHEKTCVENDRLSEQRLGGVFPRRLIVARQARMLIFKLNLLIIFNTGFFNGYSLYSWKNPCWKWMNWVKNIGLKMKFQTTWSGSDGMSVCGNTPPKKSQICSFSLLSKHLSNFDNFWWFYAYFHSFRMRFRMKILIFVLFLWKNISKTCLWCFKMHDILSFFITKKLKILHFS